MLRFGNVTYPLLAGGFVLSEALGSCLKPVKWEPSSCRLATKVLDESRGVGMPFSRSACSQRKPACGMRWRWAEPMHSPPFLNCSVKGNSWLRYTVILHKTQRKAASVLRGRYVQPCVHIQSRWMSIQVMKTWVLWRAPD